MKKILLIILVFFLGACSTGVTNLQSINYSEFKDLTENKEEFILEIIQDGCSYCNSFKPVLEEALKETDLQAKVLNLSYMSDEERKEFMEDLELNNFGTPSVFFFREGQEISSLKRLSGASYTKEEVIEKFKANGFSK